MRYISRFKNSIRASSVYSLAFMLTFALAAGLTTYEEAAAQPSVTLKLSDTSSDNVDENANAESITVIAELSGMNMLQGDATVTLSLGGTATRKDGDDENDYEVTGTLSITIPANSSMGSTSLSIDPEDDDVFEGDETITISGTATTIIGGSSRSLVVNSDISFTIVEDDYDIVLSVTNPANNDPIMESADTLSVTVQAAFDTERITVLGTPVNVTLNVQDDDRYDVVGTPTVEISAGQPNGTGTVTLVVNDDESYSSPQTIKIEGSSSAGYSVESTSVMLNDDDAEPSMLTLAVDKSKLPEEDGAQTVTVTATILGDATYAAEKMVALTLTSDPEAGDDTYSVDPEEPKVTIPAGMSYGSMTISIEPTNNQTFAADIAIMVDGAIGTQIAADAVSNTTITIVNDDFDGKIVVSPSSVTEGDEEVEVMVTAMLPASTSTEARTVTLVVNTGDFIGTAMSNDFMATSGNPNEIVVGAGDTEETVTLMFDTIADDAGYEGDETILIGGTIQGLNLKPATITVKDGDSEPTVTLSITTPDPAELEESAGGTSVTVQAELSDMTTLLTAATVTLSISGSATQQDGADLNDYAMTGNLSFEIGTGGTTGSTTLSIDPNDDNVFEGNEDIVISGTVTAVLGGGTKELDVTSDDLTVTIVDNDFDIMLTVPTENGDPATITESADTLSVTVQAAFVTTRITVLGTPVILTLDVQEDDRYTVVGTPTVEISAGQPNGTGTVTLVVNDDESYSSPQPIKIEGSTSAGYSVQTTSVMLNDDDAEPSMLTLAVDKSKLPEEDGAQTVTVTATILGDATYAAEKMVALTLTSDPEAGDDTYSVDPEEPKVTIPAGMSYGSMTISIEPTNNQTFGADIAIMVDGAIGTQIAADAVSNTTITIVNDDFDGKIVVSPSSVTEGDEEVEVMVTAMLPASTSTEARTVTLVVNMGVHMGSALPADYMLNNDNPTEIVVGAGDTEETVTFTFDTIEDDAGYEGDETFLIGGTTTGLNLKPATITVKDGDSEPTVTLSITTPDPAELAESAGSTSVIVQAELSDMTTLLTDATVTLSISGSATQMTADATNDYAMTGDLEFTIAMDSATGSTTLSIDPNDDNVFEGNEDIVISGTVTAVLGGGTKELDVTSDDLTVTIVDNDFDIMLTVPTENGDPATITESADTLSVTVQAAFVTTRITVLGNPVTVALSVAMDDRYSMVGTSSVEISAGQTSGTGTVMLVVNDDESYSSPQTINIEGESGGYSVQRTSVTLNDDDTQPSMLKLAVDKSKLPEEDGAQSVTVTATILGDATYAAEKMVALTLTSDPEAGDDTYSVDPEEPMVTIPAGMSYGSAVLMIEPVNNQTFGADIAIMVDGAIGTQIAADAVSNTTITIVNDDFDGKIVVSPSSVTEGDEEVEVMVTAMLPASSQNMARTVTLVVNMGVHMGSALPADYMLNNDNPTEIVVGAGDTEETVTFTFDTIEDDAGYEGDETFLIGGTTTGLNLKPATITVKDGDSEPTVTLSITTPDPAELAESAGSTSVIVQAELSDMTTLLTDATVTLSISGSATQMTADATNDYAMTGDLEFTIAMDSATGSTTLSIDPNDDNVFEGNEDIVISGTVTAVLGGGARELVVTSDDLMVTIVDNDFDIMLTVPTENGDPATITESADTLSVTVAAAFVTGRITVLGNPVTVALSVAMDDRYSVVGTPSVEISAGQTSGTGTVMLVVMDDESYSSPKTINITGTSPNYAVQSTSVSLVDDDDMPMNLQLTVDKSEVAEEGGAQSVTVTATIMGEATFAVEQMVALTLTSDPEAGDDTYSVDPEEPKVAIGAGMSSGSVEVTIDPADNSVVGDNIVIMVDGSIGDVIADTEVEETTITIVNDDFDGSITVTPAEVTEGDDAVTLMVTATLPASTSTTARTVTLVVNTGDVIGTAGSNDFSVPADHTNPTSIEVAAGATEETVELKYIFTDDGTFEDDETFMVGGTIPNLDLAPATVLVRDAQKATITLTVVDAEGEAITDIDEAGGMPVDVTVVATQSTQLSTPSVVTLAKIGTATKGEDYTVIAVEGTITIDAQETVGKVELTIIPVDDLMAEEDGIEIIEIAGSTPDKNLVRSANINLVDNKMIPLEYVMVEPNVIAEEDSVGTEVMITVRMMGTSVDTTHVRLDKTMGTAIPGDDFTVMAASEDFYIAPRDSMAMKMVTITPINDELVEGDEEILVEAWALDADGNDVGVVVYTGILLTDDDAIVDLPLVALSVDNNAFVEGVDGTITVTATANGSVPVPQVIALLPVLDHTTIDLADAPALFTKFATPPGVTITILPNEITGQIVIPITTVDDMVFEVMKSRSLWVGF